ncbi:hypothetical protein [Candidatus Villigracilis affinis]|uniref:hypothetical protein n=1 Tax=Candidatus Villigracilis affinis TaxID=3140682 RepID=UPI0031EAE734
MTSFAVSGAFSRNSKNFFRVDGLLNFPDGPAIKTSLFDARKGIALTALLRSFSVMVRASRRVVFMSAVVGSVKSDSKSLSLRVIANSSLP